MPPKTNEDYMREIRNIQPAHPLVYERIEQILTEKDQELQKARESEGERILALAEDVEIFTAFGYDTTTVKMIDPAKIINNKTNGL